MRARPPHLACLALALFGLSCSPEPEIRRVRQQLVVVRLAVDPATQLGELFLAQPEVAAPFREGFADVACDGALGSIVLDVDVTTEDGVGLGEGRLYLGTPADARDPCAGEGAVIVQPVSLDERGEPRVSGPLFIEGLTLDGRFPIGALFEVQLAQFPRWWRFSARLRNPVTTRPEAGVAQRLELEEAEVDSVWYASDMARVPNQREEVRGEDLLDAVVHEGFQPGVDVDGDGLERLLDTDGDEAVDTCVDGDGTEIPGADCALRPAIADGYRLRLRFRLAPVEIIE
jgi:hypothetical protein